VVAMVLQMVIEWSFTVHRFRRGILGGYIDQRRPARSPTRIPLSVTPHRAPRIAFLVAGEAVPLAARRG